MKRKPNQISKRLAYITSSHINTKTKIIGHIVPLIPSRGESIWKSTDNRILAASLQHEWADDYLTTSHQGVSKPLHKQTQMN